MTDQTQFIQEEPLFENSFLPPIPDKNEAVVKKPWYKQPGKIGAVAAIILVTLLIVLLLVSRLIQQAPEQEVFPDFTTTPTEPQELSDLQRRLRNVQADLKAVDPAQDRLPMPPVLLEIGLPQFDDIN